jgi:hypothetical protein
MAQAADAFRPDIPSTARMYDYYLGGKDNYPADREAVQRTFAVLGEDVVHGTVLQNRQFLGGRSGTWPPSRASGSSSISARGCPR